MCILEKYYIDNVVETSSMGKWGQELKGQLRAVAGAKFQKLESFENEAKGSGILYTLGSHKKF